jgi:hypothetical protein
VVKGFEHLSDAQLEQYGTESFNVTSNDAQKIDAHLEQCADCRSRVLENQRARFAFMADTPVETSAEAGCVSEDDLRNLAAGIIAPEKAPGIIQHAAECPHCARILRTFSEEFSDDLTPEELAAEKELMGQLKSLSPKWQKDMASQAMQANRSAASLSDRGEVATIPGSNSTLRPARAGGWLPRWILAPAALAACAAIAFAVWFTQRDTPEKVEKLLAQAYTEQRTMEYRWPGAEWGPVRVTRGAGQSSLSRPTAQLEAEKILAEHQASTAKNTNWLTAKAEAEILDNNPEAAIAHLTQAAAANPGSIHPEVLLAIAYAQKGDQRDDPASREKALEILNKVIAGKTPHDPAALFNRALLYQRLNMPEKAKADWDELLGIEPQNAWGDEARKKR